MKNTKIAHIQM